VVNFYAASHKNIPAVHSTFRIPTSDFKLCILSCVLNDKRGAPDADAPFFDPRSDHGNGFAILVYKTGQFYIGYIFFGEFIK